LNSRGASVDFQLEQICYVLILQQLSVISLQYVTLLLAKVFKGRLTKNKQRDREDVITELSTCSYRCSKRGACLLSADSRTLKLRTYFKLAISLYVRFAEVQCTYILPSILLVAN